MGANVGLKTEKSFLNTGNENQPSPGSEHTNDPTKPLWIQQAQSALSRLTGKSARRQRNTIIAIVHCRLHALPLKRALGRPDTINSLSFYQKYMRSPVFVAVYEEVLRLAMDAQDELALDHLNLATQKLAIAAPDAVDKAVELMEYAEKDEVALRAAWGVYDRAVASKQPTETQEDWKVVAARLGVDPEKVFAEFIKALAAGVSKRTITPVEDAEDAEDEIGLGENEIGLGEDESVETEDASFEGTAQ